MINRSFYIKFETVPTRMIGTVKKDKPYLVIDETVDGLWIFANDNNKFFHTKMEECLFAGLERELMKPAVKSDDIVDTTQIALTRIPEPESLDSELKDLKELKEAVVPKSDKGKK